ncbi:hypothetical protein H7J07_02600 [Mycobacterium koreense]|nr:hypothetical protein [Mycolicibacillus koreensis]MCV7247150.1 hypothetical protein [Mycolicibacillus koreensis]BBY55899.1 hypothetical protein MKOR_31500 [Mycolicibacillus koreensis]
MAKQPVYQCDVKRSRERARKLQAYLTRKVAKSSTKTMVCDRYCDCKKSADKKGAAFFESQGHSVGSHFDLFTESGTPLRVLVVPMEAGGGDKHTSATTGGSAQPPGPDRDRYRTVRQRTEVVRESGEMVFAQRNPHMQGVTLALQLAFGLPVEKQEQLHFIDEHPAHVFDCFAMANLLLCSAVPKPGSHASFATSVMRKNCALHLAQSVRILQPTLVISQGWGLVDTLRQTFGTVGDIGSSENHRVLAECDLDGNRFIWVGLTHPAHGNWSRITSREFQPIVAPAIREGRQRALRLAARTG